MASTSMRGQGSAFTTPGLPTPIRAITTPLRSTAAPPIPPPSALYEPLAKSILQRRLTRRIFPLTFGVCVGAAVVWLPWIGALGLRPVFGAAMGTWVCAVVPVVLVKKAYLTVTHTTAASPFLLLKKSVTPGPLRARTLHALQAYVFSALAVLAVHAALDPAIPVFIKSRKHPYTPHPTLVLLATTQILFAALYVLRATLRDAWVFPFRRPNTPTPTLSAFLTPLLLALATLPLALVLLFIVIPVLKRLPLLSSLLRPLLRPHLSAALFVHHLPRACALGVKTGWVWEVCVGGGAGEGGVWGWVVGEPVHTTPAPRALISGVSVAVTPMPVSSASGSSASNPASAFATPARASSIFLSGTPTASSFSAPTTAPAEPSIYTHLAYTELLRLASSEGAAAAKARGEVFDVEGAVWGRFVREALVLLGREYRVLLAKGGAVPAPPPPPPAAAPTPGSASYFASGGTPASTIASGSTPSPIMLHKQNIFAPRKAPSSPAARIASLSSSVFASAPDGDEGGIEAFLAPAVKSTAAVLPAAPPLPKWEWRPLVRALMPIVPVPAWVKGAVGTFGGGGHGHGWRRERKGREVRGWVPRGEVVVECIGVLTHLTTASLTEDRFGVVQRDIPRILEALVAFLVAIEEAQAQLRPQEPKTTQKEDLPEDERVLIGVVEAVEDAVGVTRDANGKGGRRVDAELEADLAEARAVLGEVGDALTDGLARIARTFGDKLRAFRLPPRTAARLAAFVEFS
ncbi:hypothetical protein C8R46DRAFT_1077674 [Mycena filopes]|nr:hypothetical protein C8R46DRAFT_1077674 [Mycena filopes]